MGLNFDDELTTAQKWFSTAANRSKVLYIAIGFVAGMIVSTFI